MSGKSIAGCLATLGLLLALLPRAAVADPVVEKTRGSVVRVICVYYFPDQAAAGKYLPIARNKQRVLVSLGSGFAIGRDGLIGTNDHVASMEIWKKPALQALVDRHILEPELYVGRLTKDDAAEIYPATISWRDPRVDLALIEAHDLKISPLKMNVGDIFLSDKVYAMGFPGAADSPEDEQAAQGWLDAGRPAHIDAPSEPLRRFLTLTVNESTVRRNTVNNWLTIDGYHEGPNIPMIENDCQFSPGNSGGPLINIAGQVIGVNTATSQQLRISSNIKVLHEAMQGLGSRYTHAWTRSRPSTISWALIAGIGGAALLGITGVVLAFRSRQTISRTTLLGILGEGRSLRRRPPPMESGPPPLSGDFEFRAPPTEEHHFEEAPPLERTQHEERHRSGTDFELAPMDHRHSPLELDGRRFAGQNGRLILGRSSTLAHICLDDRNVSNRHAAVRVRGDKLYIEDLESSNGTEVNGRRLEPFSDVQIMEGDTISLGGLEFRLRERLSH